MMINAEPKYTPEQLRFTKAAAVSHALNMLAENPDDERVKAYANEIMSTDPGVILDTAERLRNPVVF